MCVHGCNCTESDNHLFFHCQVARAIWFAIPWSIRWDGFIDRSLDDKLVLLANGALPVHLNDRDDFFLFGALILDQIWKIRNYFLFENKSFSLENIMEFLNFRFKEAKTALNKNDSCALTSVANTVACHKVSPEYIRINTDVAIKMGRSMVGIVARNFEGEVLGLWAIPFQLDTPELAEAFGIFQGLLKAKEDVWSKIWCESDAKKIIFNLENNNMKDLHWMVEGVIKDTLHLKNWFGFRKWFSAGSLGKHSHVASA
nr:uncharacterized protein LOC125423723 [Ziziphus jujuba var. spinosa]